MLPLQILVLFAGLCLNGNITGWPFFAATLAVALAGRYRMLALAAVNATFLIFLDLTFKTRNSIPSAWAQTLSDMPFWSQIILRLFALSLTFAIFVGLWKIHGRTKFRYLLTLNFAALLILIGVHEVESGTSLAAVSLWFVTCLFAKYFWMMTFSHLAFRFRDRIVMWEWLAVLPYWQCLSNWHIGSIPRGFGELEKTSMTSSTEAARGRTQAIQFIAIGVAAYFIGPLLTGALEMVIHIADANRDSLHEIVQLNVSGWQLWTLDFMYGLSAVFRNIWAVCMICGVARFSGFQIPSPIGAVWKARNFMEFIRRYYYYYSETISYFILPGCWRLVQKLPLSLRFQNAAVIFLSLLTGGLITHFVEDVPYTLGPGFDFIYSFAKKMPYIVALATIAAISSFFHKAGKKERVRIIPMFYYFGLYFFARTFEFWSRDDAFANPTKADLTDYWHFLLNHLHF